MEKTRGEIVEIIEEEVDIRVTEEVAGKDKTINGTREDRRTTIKVIEEEGIIEGLSKEVRKE